MATQALCRPTLGGGAAAATRLLRLVHVQLAARKVVEEEHGLRAGRDDVVHAHGHQVDANLVGEGEGGGELAVRGGQQTEACTARRAAAAAL